MLRESRDTQILAGVGWLLRGSFGSLALLLLAAGASHAKPNILLLLTDDQAYDAVHSLGWSEVRTPNLDRLVERGVTFTHAYNQGSWTGAVCIASRTMLVTGRSLWRARRDQHHLAERYVRTGRTWPQRMGAAGYRTCFTGKWHVKADPEQVFDDVRHVRPGMPKDAPYMYDRPREGQPDPFDPADKTQGGYWSGGTHWSEVVADDVIDMLAPPAGDTRPFFIYAGFNAPHDPRQAPPEYLRMYPPQELVVPPSFLPENPFAEAMGAGRSLRDERLAPFPRTKFAVRTHRAEYAAIITHLDAQIGRILDALDKQQLTDETRIIFSSDHGLAVGRHGLMGKQNLYEHSVRVPLVVAGPGLPAGERISQRVYMQDIHPTTLSWAGAASEASDFRDLSPLLGGEQSGRGKVIYGAYLDRQRMILSGDWKLIVYPTHPRVLLYNLADDPQELEDLAGRKEYRPVVQQLLSELRATQARMGDNLELPDALAATD